MGLVFTRINLAISNTLELFEKGKFKDYMRYFTNGSNNYLHDWDKYILRTHKQMDDEIYQTVDTCNNLTKVFMFEELRKWVNDDWRLAEKINEAYFWGIAVNHNEKEEAELDLKVKESVVKMLEHPNYNKYDANEEYEEERPPKPSFFYPKNSLLSAFHELSAQKITHRKIFCIDFSTDFIDYYQIKKYTQLLQSIVDSLRGIVLHHLALYDAGKYVTPAEVIIQKEVLDQKNLPPASMDNIKQSAPKIGLNINVRKLLFIFRLLIEEGIIKEPETLKNMFYKISDCFETDSTADMTVDQLQKKWSDIDPKIAKYWEGVFINLSKKSRKYNPNNVQIKSSKPNN
jgi:hypothetical protein